MRVRAGQREYAVWTKRREPVTGIGEVTTDRVQKRPTIKRAEEQRHGKKGCRQECAQRVIRLWFLTISSSAARRKKRSD